MGRLSHAEQVIALAYLRMRLQAQVGVWEHQRSLARRRAGRWASQYYADGVIEGLSRAINECDLALDHVERSKEFTKSNGS